MKIVFKMLLLVLLLKNSITIVNGQEAINIKTLIRYELDSIDGVYIPHDIYDSFKEIDSFLSDSLKNEIKEMTEFQFVGNAHLGFGMSLRNNWGLWGGSKFSYYFNKLGIFHPDDMSGLILTSYYRYLLKIEIAFEDQISYYKNYWETAKNNSVQEKVDVKPKVLKKNLDGYKKGRNIRFNYPYGFSSEQEEDYSTMKNSYARGKMIDVDFARKLIKIRLIKCYSPFGVIIYDSSYGMFRYKEEEYDSDGKIIPKNGRQIFYMKKGDEFWFSLKDDFWDW